LSVNDDGIHKTAVKEEAALVDSFKNTQVRGSTKDRDKMFGEIIEKFDSVINSATKAVTDSTKEDHLGFTSGGITPDYDNCIYGTYRGLLTKYSGNKVAWAKIDVHLVHLIGATIRIKIQSDYQVNGPNEFLKVFENAHNLLPYDSLEYSAYAIN
jgi:hypothetical protein